MNSNNGCAPSSCWRARNRSVITTTARTLSSETPLMGICRTDPTIHWPRTPGDLYISAEGVWIYQAMSVRTHWISGSSRTKVPEKVQRPPTWNLHQKVKSSKIIIRGFSEIDVKRPISQNKLKPQKFTSDVISASEKWLDNKRSLRFLSLHSPFPCLSN